MVLFLYSSPVRVHRLVVAEKRRNQHDKRAFRQVKIGYQPVEHLELKAGIYEYLRSALAGYYTPVKRRSGFKSAAGGSTDRDDASAFRLCFRDKLCCTLGYLIMLAVHLMVENAVFLDGAERSEPDVQ